VFYELRLLISIRAGVARSAIRLDARLGDLMPSWSFQFWKRVQLIFAVELPHGNALSRIVGSVKRTTIRELVVLMAAAKS